MPIGVSPRRLSCHFFHMELIEMWYSDSANKVASDKVTHSIRINKGWGILNIFSFNYLYSSVCSFFR